MQIGVVLGKAELLPLAAADTELVDAAVSQQIVAAADHTGMAEPGAQIVVPQVRVGVEVEDMQVGIAPASRPHAAQGHQMLSADEQGQFAVCEISPQGLDIAEPSRRCRSKSSRSPLSNTEQSVRSYHDRDCTSPGRMLSWRMAAELDRAPGRKLVVESKVCTERDNLRFLVAALAAMIVSILGSFLYILQLLLQKRRQEKRAGVKTHR